MDVGRCIVIQLHPIHYNTTIDGHAEFPIGRVNDSILHTTVVERVRNTSQSVIQRVQLCGTSSSVSIRISALNCMAYKTTNFIFRNIDAGTTWKSWSFVLID